MKFTIRLSAAATKTVSVSYATANGTGTAPSDYRTKPLTSVNLPAGSTSKAVSVTVVGDRTREADETLFLDLSKPVNATVADSRGVGTMVNDD